MMERRMRWKLHVRCEVGEKVEIISKPYLSLLIVKTIELLRENEEVLEYYQNKFKYILVDEYQDSATRC